MNEYKEAWLAACELLPMIAQDSDKDPQEYHESYSSMMITRQTEAAVLSLAHWGMRQAAKNQMKGKLGIYMRVGGRIGTRVVPVIGFAITVYDAYRFFDALLEDED